MIMHRPRSLQRVNMTANATNATANATANSTANATAKTNITKRRASNLQAVREDAYSLSHAIIRHRLTQSLLLVTICTCLLFLSDHAQLLAAACAEIYNGFLRQTGFRRGFDARQGLNSGRELRDCPSWRPNPTHNSHMGKCICRFTHYCVCLSRVSPKQTKQACILPDQIE